MRFVSQKDKKIWYQFPTPYSSNAVAHNSAIASLAHSAIKPLSLPPPSTAPSIPSSAISKASLSPKDFSPTKPTPCSKPGKVPGSKKVPALSTSFPAPSSIPFFPSPSTLHPPTLRVSSSAVSNSSLSPPSKPSNPPSLQVTAPHWPDIPASSNLSSSS